MSYFLAGAAAARLMAGEGGIIIPPDPVSQELGASPGAHRYWRIRGLDNSGNATYIGWSQIELRDTVGGADITGSGTPAAVGPIQAGSAAAMFNNAPTTDIIQWQIAAGMPNNEVWVSYDFGAGNDKDIKEVKIWPNKDQASRTPRIFNIEWSDDNTNWHISWTAHNHNWIIGTPGTFARPTFAAAMRYWRIRYDSAADPTQAAFVSAAEIEFRETVGGADAASGGTAISSFHNGTEVPANAFDNNTTTLFAAASNSWTPRRNWIGYDFGSGVTKEINEVSYTARNDTFFGQSLGEGWIESSTDGINFIPRWDIAATFTAAGQTKVISRPIGVTTPLYRNKGGRGDRTSFITATTDLLMSTAPYQTTLINGTYSNTSWFNSGNAGKHLTFDFGIGVKITEAIWYQSAANTQGVWKWQGSNDGSTWTDIGSSFTLGSPATQILTELQGNTASYRYYRMQQVSGTTTSSPYTREIEFRIAGL